MRKKENAFCKICHEQFFLAHYFYLKELEVQILKFRIDLVKHFPLMGPKGFFEAAHWPVLPTNPQAAFVACEKQKL